jgi:hypothetical protein
MPSGPPKATNCDGYSLRRVVDELGKIGKIIAGLD